ncbi:imelysin family protein [Marinobacter sp. LV10MA510-1]|uniref:imelysin family protein n=1 Tax=Marinobacter sp. LV10MA510-1 TaxID=1415567 RepID=UPI000BF6B80B|nr:imelysin family protein [Marinobacter sp. LV10MA510-1]PFG09611.1 hypothetical protein ATI45_1995 [Marinobacter sp. LV10MA510-1]
MLRLTRYFRTAAIALLMPTLALPGLALAASAESGTAVEQQTRAGWHQAIGRGYQALPVKASCQLLVQVATHVVDNSQQLVADWSEFKPHYLATDNYTHATIRAAMTALEVAEERRLATPMGLRGNGKRSAYAADAWRSGSSLASIGASVDGLQQYFLPGLEKLLTNQGDSDLAERIHKQFGEVQEHFPAMDLALAPLLEDDNAFRSLQGLYVDLSQLTTLVNGEAATSLGVIRGFNSSDGD